MNYDNYTPDYYREYNDNNFPGCCSLQLVSGFPFDPLGKQFDFSTGMARVRTEEEKRQAAEDSAWNMLCKLNSVHMRQKVPVVFTLTDKQSIMRDLVEACPDVKLLHSFESSHKKYNVHLYVFDKKDEFLQEEEVPEEQVVEDVVVEPVVNQEGN